MTEKDDWSLKSHVDIIEFEFYNPEDVETLRKKLIADCEEIKENDYDYIPYVIECVVKTINKRFGVEK